MTTRKKYIIHYKTDGMATVFAHDMRDAIKEFEDGNIITDDSETVIKCIDTTRTEEEE